MSDSSTITGDATRLIATPPAVRGAVALITNDTKSTVYYWIGTGSAPSTGLGSWASGSRNNSLPLPGPSGTVTTFSMNTTGAGNPPLGKLKGTNAEDKK